MGYQFRGVYNIYKNSFAFFKSNKTRIEEDIKIFDGLNDKGLDEIFGQDAVDQLKEVY